MLKYKLSTRQIASKIGDEVVILDHEEGIYYSLEAVGQTVWSALETAPCTLEELTQHVCHEYDTTPDACQADLQNLLDDLLRQKLVELS